mmetsp:Transcript_18959/g.37390  ORF Transcript_18959/g.37390 Transcript_18959/m.37390 type:complete len:235 (+) Transcript_18959:3479-4183(+)
MANGNRSLTGLMVKLSRSCSTSDGDKLSMPAGETGDRKHLTQTTLVGTLKLTSCCSSAVLPWKLRTGVPLVAWAVKNCRQLPAGSTASRSNVTSRLATFGTSTLRQNTTRLPSPFCSCFRSASGPRLLSSPSLPCLPCLPCLSCPSCPLSSISIDCVRVLNSRATSASSRGHMLGWCVLNVDSKEEQCSCETSSRRDTCQPPVPPGSCAVGLRQAEMLKCRAWLLHTLIDSHPA